MIRCGFEKSIEVLLALASLVSLLTIATIVLTLGLETSAFFERVSWSDFVSDSQWTPLFLEKHFGIAPLLCGTLLTSSIALLFAVPVGLVIATYLSEFAAPSVRAIFKPLLEVLNGIPTIVFGYFALLAITPLLQKVIPSLGTFNALSAGLALGLMILPIVSSLIEDTLSALPDSYRAGALALGASRMQMVIRVLWPAGLSGITAAVILAVARAIGETMIVAIAAGQIPTLSLNPLGQSETMTAYIAQISLGDTPHGTLEYHTIYAVGAALFLMTLTMNTLSLWIKGRYAPEEQA